MWRAPAIAVVLTSQALLLSAVGLSAHLLQQQPPPPAAAAAPPAVIADTRTEQAWRGMALAMLAERDRDTPAQRARLEEEGIIQLSAQAYRLHEPFWSDALGGSDGLSRSLRVIPYREDGAVVGFRLSGLRRGSLLERAGVKNGDVLLRLNGEQITHTSQCFAIFQPRPDMLTVEVLRRGEPHMLVWELVR